MDALTFTVTFASSFTPASILLAACSIACQSEESVSADGGARAAGATVVFSAVSSIRLVACTDAVNLMDDDDSLTICCHLACAALALWNRFENEDRAARAGAERSIAVTCGLYQLMRSGRSRQDK